MEGGEQGNVDELEIRQLLLRSGVKIMLRLDPASPPHTHSIQVLTGSGKRHWKRKVSFLLFPEAPAKTTGESQILRTPKIQTGQKENKVACPTIQRIKL